MNDEAMIAAAKPNPPAPFPKKEGGAEAVTWKIISKRGTRCARAVLPSPQKGGVCEDRTSLGRIHIFNFQFSIRNSLPFALCAVLLLASVRAEDSKPEPLRVLFVGNSFTYYNEMPYVLQQMAAAAGARELEYELLAEGGYALKDHLKSGQFLKLLRERRWDFVVLQEQSALPVNDREEMFKAARLMDAEIQKKGAKTVFFETWAPKGDVKTQSAISEAYAKLAKELRAMVAPAGAAWQLVLKKNPKLELYDPDGRHPNAAGSYLAACVLYATLYGKSPLGLVSSVRTPRRGTAEPMLVELSKEDAAAIQQSVAKTLK